MRTAVRWDGSEAGCWEMIQLHRELLGLLREAKRPDGFSVWFKRALAQSGADGITAIVRGYVGDTTIRARGWPTNVLIGKGGQNGVWDARAAQMPLEAHA